MQALESVELQHWLKKIEAFHPREIDLGLDRISRIAKFLDCLELSCPVVSVAGTNGKGSCVELLNAFAQSHGLKVGVYTSPHLFRFNERIRINGTQVSDGQLIESFEKIKSALDVFSEKLNSEKNCSEIISSETISLSFFEYTTLAALLIFKQAKLDLVVLEVGLGGRLDAVNIIDADVAVITSIGIDHEAWLGNTRELVALEKAGIARTGKPVIVGDANPPQNLKQYLDELGAITYFRNQQFYLENKDDSKSVFHFQQADVSDMTKLECDGTSLSLSAENILTALQAFACVCHKISITMNLVKLEQSCYQTFLVGRFQVFEHAGEKLSARNTLERVIVDLTHNPAGAVFFRQQLIKFEKQQRLGKVMAVFGVMKDKDIKGILAELIDRVDLWLVCSLDSERSAKANELEQLVKGMNANVSVKCFNEPDQAISWALDESEGLSSLLVFGSFFTVGPAMQCMEKRGLIKLS